MRKNKTPKEKKPKASFKETYGKLVTFCKPYKFAILISVLLGIVSVFLLSYAPKVITQIMESITKGLFSDPTFDTVVKEVTKLSLFLLVAYIVASCLNYVQGLIMNIVTQRVVLRLRTDISQKINKLPFSYFDKTNYGDVLSRVVNDVDMIGSALNNSLVSTISAVTQFILVFFFMLFASWQLTIVAVLSTFMGFFIMAFIMSKSQKYFVSQQEYTGLLNAHIEEAYSGHQVISAFNAQKEVKREFKELNKKLRNSSFKSQFIAGLAMPLMMFIGNFAFVIICIASALLIINGHITLGVFAAFQIFIRLFINPFATLAQNMQGFQQAGAASKRVFEFIEEKEIEDETHKTLVLDNVKGDVEFNHVKFGYDSDKVIIKDFSAKIKAGQKIAIVGPTGAGKTTLVNLLMRFYEVNSGTIKIDGVDTSLLTRENVRSLFSMVLQDTWIFDGTIKENIIFDKNDISYEELKEVCKAANLHHYVRTLSNGYDTVLNEESSLSSGQRQLLTIARAMLVDRPMLILDEATSNVDTRTEVLIQKAMDNLMKGRTAFVIAHRLSTIKNSDLILVLKDGDIIESGTHNELLSQKGFYEQLYNSQFEEVE